MATSAHKLLKVSAFNANDTGRQRCSKQLQDLPPLASVEATGVCIPLGNSEVLFAAVCKSPGRVWRDTDITELLSSTRKSIMAGDVNAKNPI
jgi:hypothetical protein